MTTAAEFDQKYDIIDTKTPPNTLLSGRYKQSFAYRTMRDRLPVTLTTIIDNLTRDKDEMVAKYGEDAREETKTVLGHLSKLKYQLQTDKPLEEFTGNEPDKKVWNTFLKSLPADANTYFKACWLYSECYLYRRVSSHFEATKTLRSFDYFNKLKVNAMVISTNAIEKIIECTRHMNRDSNDFCRILKLNLWGNRCDLSITSGREVKPGDDPFELVNIFEPNLLVDNSPDAWKCLNTPTVGGNVIVDFVCDNAGYEVFTDFILAEYLIDQKLASKVRFHVKAIPWFISDVTPGDFHWSIEFLSSHASPVIKALGAKLDQFLKEGKWELMEVEHFWTSPYEFYRMKQIDPDLYACLAQSHLVIFKGDLNYRKLIGDYSWDFTEKFDKCLRGFRPTNICSLRTIKADLICGLSAGEADKLFDRDPNWMLTGEFALIQYAPKIDGTDPGCSC